MQKSIFTKYCSTEAFLISQMKAFKIPKSNQKDITLPAMSDHDVFIV
jgi:hypothetical protein